METNEKEHDQCENKTAVWGRGKNNLQIESESDLGSEFEQASVDDYREIWSWLLTTQQDAPDPG